MNVPHGWKLVPVEPTPAMTAAYAVAAEELTKRHLLSGSYPATWQPVEAGYTAMLAAAPTPPVVLPPLPSPRVPAVFATAENTESVRKGYEPGGYEKSPPLFDERQVREAQRAALAQYGIVDRQEDAA